VTLPIESLDEDTVLFPAMERFLLLRTVIVDGSDDIGIPGELPGEADFWDGAGSLDRAD
jgi:hypothetical protein